MLRLEFLTVKADLERGLEGFVTARDCGSTVHQIAGFGVSPGHWAPREPAPHHEPAV